MLHDLDSVTGHPNQHAYARRFLNETFFHPVHKGFNMSFNHTCSNISGHDQQFVGFVLYRWTNQNLPKELVCQHSHGDTPASISTLRTASNMT